MLVLTRRKNQVVQIGDNIRLHVVSISGRTVKLAFEAPRDVPINRGEVQQRIDLEPKVETNPGETSPTSPETLSV